MLVDALRDQRVRDLEEQRPRAGTEQEHRLAVEAPGLGSGAVQPGELGVGRDARGPGRQRSLGRRPTTHHANGKTAAAASSLIVSTTRNGSMPSSIAFDSDSPVVTASHGTPTA